MFKLPTGIDLAVHCSCVGVELGTNVKSRSVSFIEKNLKRHEQPQCAFVYVLQ